jgi:protein arginine kinase activator
MLCGRCGQREATIHEVLIDQHGGRQERHLCEQCAQSAGLSGGAGATIGEILQKFMVGPGGPAATAAGKAAQAAASAARCESCGLAFSEFKQSGLLGCPGCYDAFDARLGPLLERAHEGGGHHVGKVPVRALSASRTGAEQVEKLLGDLRARHERLASLRAQLAKAVQGEAYERAAELKREIDRVSGLYERCAEGEGPEAAS